MKNTWWLSLHPKWAELVKAGKKTMELRKKLPTKNMKAGDMVIVYTTLPVGKIEMVWEVVDYENYGYRDALLFEHKHCVPSQELHEYTKNSPDNLFGIDFKTAHKDLNITLSAIKQAGFTPPQGIVKGDKLAKHFKMEM